MKTHSGSTSEGFFPATLTGTSGGTALAPAPDNPAATFADHLDEQQGNAPPPAPAGLPFAVSLAESMPAPADTSLPTHSVAPAGPPAEPSAAAPTTVVSYFSGTSSPFAQLATAFPALTPDSQTAPPAPPLPATPTAPTASDAASASSPLPPPVLGRSDLSVMLARASLLTLNARAARATTPPSGASTPSTVSTADPETEATTAEEAGALPLHPSVPTPAGASPTEKKSAPSAAERSFIQADLSLASTLGLALTAPFAPASNGAQSIDNKSLARSASNAESGIPSLSAGSLEAAGMASGKKEDKMNATLEMTDLMVSTGSNPAIARTPADVNILLGTNHDFHDALEQVMHVAELSNLSASTPPLRVAIEIQTPPGAVVNLYVSRQPDETYRAQLGTDDIQALHWVQDQIGSLKQSTDTGVAVRWLPAQLETAPAATFSSGSTGQDTAWNRGGQGWQQQQQQADERPQPRPRRGSFANRFSPDLALPFIGALGRAA